MMAASGPLRTFVDGAANDWIEPLTDIVCEKRDVRFVPGAVIRLPVPIRVGFLRLLEGVHWKIETDILRHSS
jgi:hypothetical protein